MKRPYVINLFMAVAISMTWLSQAAAEEAKPWEKEISLGYNQSSGNTDNSQLTVSGAVKRAWENSEFSSTADVYYSETDNKMDSQKWISATRYAFDFGEDKVWFNSYQLTVDHDRFADIDYRILPAAGLGYWFSKDDDFKLMSEASLGYQITEYRSGKADEEEAVFIARGYLEKKVWDRATFSEDLSFIPSLEEGSYRIKSETKFTNPISADMDIDLKYIVDYDSDPAEGKTTTDTRFITALKYKF